MTIESIISIVSGLLGIALAIPVILGYIKNSSLSGLMKQLVDNRLATQKHRKKLKKMNRKLRLFGVQIKEEYINSFVLNDRKKEAVFMDICEKNEIEPTKDICVKFLGSDMPKFRTSYLSKRKPTAASKAESVIPAQQTPSKPIITGNDRQTVYMSELLMSRHPMACKQLISILEKHNIKYAFIKGTNDIWCRDYMPVQTESGKLIQFKYEPSYLKGNAEWEASRSNVDEIHRLNNINATPSDINLDGGNVLICDGRAILSDRIFGENPGYEKDALVKELSRLLECEIIIIPSLRSKEEDFTGHADGMVRFVDRNTIVGNNRANEYKYWQDGMKKVLDTYNLTYIDIPCIIQKKDPKHPDSAIGVYVNFLDVNDLIVVPVFGRDEDKEVVEILQKTYPNKQIETIDYNEVAIEGGLLNCSTWVVK